MINFLEIGNNLPINKIRKNYSDKLMEICKINSKNLKKGIFKLDNKLLINAINISKKMIKKIGKIQHIFLYYKKIKNYKLKLFKLKNNFSKKTIKLNKCKY